METICMNCQIPFPEKNKKNIANLLFAELAQWVVKVNKFILILLFHTFLPQ